MLIPAGTQGARGPLSTRNTGLSESILDPSQVFNSHARLPVALPKGRNVGTSAALAGTPFAGPARICWRAPKSNWTNRTGRFAALQALRPPGTPWTDTNEATNE